MSDLGLIYTSGSLPSYRAALAALGATWVKLIPAWWPHGPTSLAPRTLVRSSWGDPSYDNGRRAYPDPAAIVEEFAPWAHIPGVALEIGNEPNVSGLDPRRYGEALSAAVAACRAAFGTATPIVAGSLSMNQAHRADAAAWLVAMGPALRACDGVAIHAYTLEEADAARRLVRQHVSGTLPLWMTECNVNAPLSPAARAVAVREMAEGCAVATLYHWCEQPGDDPTHFNPYYTLTLADLAALRAPVLGSSAPAVEWVGMSRKRWDSRDGARPRAVVIHATGGTNSYEWLRKGGETRPVSAHYLVSKSGQIWQFVRDADRAWHAGEGSIVVDGVRSTDPNDWSIGIEVENHNDGRDPYPAAQLDAAAALTRRLVAQYDIPRSQVVRHLDVAPGRKNDPAGLDWPAFLGRVFAPVDPWAAWGAAHPLPPEQRGYSIPRAWLAEQQAGRPLGAATGPEAALGPGRAARAFERGVVVWLGGDRTEVVR